MEIFKAGVQYNDLMGSVAADRSDNLSFIDYLRGRDLANDDEHIIGYRFGFNENHMQKIINLGLVIYLLKGENEKEIRAIEVEMPSADFFSYFKRFDLVMTSKGFDLDGVEVSGPYYD